MVPGVLRKGLAGIDSSVEELDQFLQGAIREGALSAHVLDLSFIDSTNDAIRKDLNALMSQAESDRILLAC